LRSKVGQIRRANLVPSAARDEGLSPAPSNLTLREEWIFSSFSHFPAGIGFLAQMLTSYSLSMNSTHDNALFSSTIDSPVGELSLVASDRALVALVWRREAHRGAFHNAAEQPEHGVLRETTRQLREYFAGKRRQFDLELDFRGTDFQRRVWSTLLTIPYGETRTYGQIAEQIGNPTAVRAVGAANGRNPISIVAPCHRVIGMNGDLTGFGGGLDAKAYLLNLEAPQKQLLAG